MMGWTDPRRGGRSRDDAGQALCRLAGEQAGYFTTGQALRLGVASDDIDSRLAEGSWLRIDRDLFRLSEFPHSDLEEFAKWCAWFDGTAVVSHHSAAELHGMGQLHPKFMHLSTPEWRPVPTQLLALHRRVLCAQDCEQTGAFRITTPLRTVIDLAGGGISQEMLDESVRDAVVIGRLDPRQLHEQCAHQSAAVADRIERALAACG